MNRKTLKILYNLFPRNKVKTISVTNKKSNGNLMVGGFYTPCHQVENNMDNDGGVHPGSLQYYSAEFQRMDSNG